MKPQSIDARRRALVTKIQTEGAEAAYRAALEVCLDGKAPAPARATCATTLLRAGGYLNAKPVDAAPKEAHEMSAEELQVAIDEIQSRRISETGDDDPDEATAFVDLFG